MRLLACILLFFSAKVFSQEPVAYTINKQLGLPSNTVYDLVQDSLGFIWIAHDKGISKYDGVNFTHYSNPTKKSKSFSNLMVWQGKNVLFQDFASNFYKIVDDSICIIKEIKPTGIFISNITHNNILYRLNTDTVELWNNKLFKKIHTGVNEIIVSSCIQKNDLYILTTNYIYQYTNYKFVKRTPIDSSKFYKYIVPRSSGGIAVFGKNNIYSASILNNNSFIEKAVTNKVFFIRNIITFGKEIWVCTSTGAFCLNENLQPLYGGKVFFEKDIISNVVKDAQNNYWFCTINAGVKLVNNLLVQQYQNITPSITSVAVKDSTELLIGTAENSILSYNINNSKFLPIFKHEDNNEVNTIFYNQSQKMLLFGSGNTTILSPRKPTIKLDFASKSFINYYNQFYIFSFSAGIAAIKNPLVKKPLQIPFSRWAIGGRTINNYKATYLIEGSRSRSLAFNPTDTILYAATVDSLYMITNFTKTTVKFKGREVIALQLLYYNNLVYAATINDGLLIIKNDTVIEQLGNGKNATDNTIYHVKQYKDEIWFASDNILYLYNTHTKKLQSFTAANGLPILEIKDMVVINNYIYLATSTGLVKIQKQNLALQLQTPICYVNYVLVNNKKYEQLNNTILKPTENNLQINFSIIDYKSLANVDVEYNINDEGWIRLQKNQRTLILPALNSGKYTIKIRGINSVQTLPPQPAILQFTITKPLVKQWWFLGLIAFFVIVTSVGFYNFRIQQIQQQAALQSEKDQLEKALQSSILSSIKSQMNPHFLFNALNTIQSFIYKNNKEKAAKYLSKFSILTRTVLEMSNKETILLSEEIKTLELYLELEKQRFEDSLQYEITVDKIIDADFIAIPPMILQPYVENAIKHGLLHKKSARQLQINFTQQNNYIKVAITDNGVGRKKSRELNAKKNKHHQSFAMNANQKRLDILNKGLANQIGFSIVDNEDAYGNAVGTTVNISIPILKK